MSVPTQIRQLYDMNGNPLFDICPYCNKKVLSLWGGLEQARRHDVMNDTSLDFYRYYWDCDCEQSQKAREEETEKYKKEQERVAREKFAKILNEACIPLCYYDSHISEWSCCRVRQKGCCYASKVCDFIKHKSTDTPGNLIVCGKTGTGKTKFVLCLGVELLRESVHVKYVNFSSILTELHDSKNFKGEKLKDVIARYARCTVLIVDDFCSEEPSPGQIGRLFEIFNERQLNSKPTIITTRFTDSKSMLEQLSPSYGSSSRRDAGIALDLIGCIKKKTEQINMTKKGDKP